MRLGVISFTEKGTRLSERIAKMLEGDMEVRLYTKCRTGMRERAHPSVLSVDTSVGEWTGKQMQERNALLFIGACGIAVRAVAPHLTDKLHDAPVLVMDENSNYIIPILSGHMGGANELAVCIAKKTGARPVITTATDINQRFAADLFAKRNGLSITDKGGIARVSSKALAGQEITISIEPGHGAEETSCLPEGVQIVPYPPAGTVDLVITAEERAFDAALLLRPKEYILGMGCRRGKSLEEIHDLITKKTGEAGIAIAQICALASVSQKSDEQGMAGWCRREGIPFLTYPAEELRKVKGDFKESSFVEAQVGVGNVCERAALRACEGAGALVVPRYAKNGMTIAIVKREWRVCFHGE